MFKQFPFFKQRDTMDCGPTCLRMVAAFHGKNYTLPYLRAESHISREGVSMEGICNAAEQIGLRAVGVKIPFTIESAADEDNASLMNAPMPCIVYWQQRHFIVVKKVTRKYVWVADPAIDQFKLPRKVFEKSWLSDGNKGVALLMDTTPEFYRLDNTLHLDKPTGLLSLLDYLRPFRGLVVNIVVAMFIGSIFQLIFPLMTQSIVDVGIENHQIGFIYLILMGQLMLFGSQTMIEFIQSRILLHVGTRINVAMVNDFLIKIMRLPIGYFDSKMVGDLMQRVGDQSRIESFLTNSALSIVFSLFNFVVFSVLLFLYNPNIFGIFLLSAALYIGWIAFFLRQRKELDYMRFQQMSSNQGMMIEMVQGMQELKLQGSEHKHRMDWGSIQAKIFYISQKSLSLRQWQEAGAVFINQLKDIVIVFVAAKAVVAGQLSLGSMLAMQYVVGQLNAPLQQFIGFIRAAQDAKLSLERMGEIENQIPEEDPHRKNAEIPEGSADFTLEKVSFHYNALADDVLKNVSLTIPKGKVTAIVGTSGSGKTTLVKLLLGFYPPSSGKICVGAVDMAYISPKAWRKCCGAVLQDGYIFSKSIADNIAESDDDTDRKKLLRAVKIANIQEFVEQLPLGYNTKIGSAGNGLSAGQKQRLLIARAVYKDPNFLFFDEATNALDANNERTIVENLDEYYRDKTVVVVAHRLSTVKNADQIVVMEKGEVVEIGTHQDLVEKRGKYFELVRNQLELGS